MEKIVIHIRNEEEFDQFLNLHDFEVEELGNRVYRVVRGEELPVFVSVNDNSLYFEVRFGRCNVVCRQGLLLQAFGPQYRNSTGQFRDKQHQSGGPAAGIG